MNERFSTNVKVVQPVTIYVESRLDAALYELLCGPPKVSGLIFREPKKQHVDKGGGRGGFRSVMNATLADRASSEGRPSSFGLLDGEESSRFGHGTELFTSSQIVFSMNDPRAKGLIFLSCYEKENLYLRYGNALKMMKNRSILGLRNCNLKTGSVQIDPAFDATIRTSIAKCAAKPILANLRDCVTQNEANILEARVFEIIEESFSKKSSAVSGIFDRVREIFPNSGLQERYSRRVREIYQALDIDPYTELKLTAANRYLTAICDGKAMFDLVMHRDQNYSFEDMAVELLDLGFGIEFRSAVQAAISGKAIHRSRNALDEELSTREPLAFRLMDKLQPSLRDRRNDPDENC